MDDDRTVLRLYKILLRSIGYKEIMIAHDGKEAVEKFRRSSEKPKIIIMDYRMPEMSGIDAMEEIFRMSEDPCVIFASADSSVKVQALSRGASAFLNKPFDVKRLLSLVREKMSATAEELERSQTQS